jgi:hypothetical protein
MVKKIALLGFISGFALFLYARKALCSAPGARAGRVFD